MNRSYLGRRRKSPREGARLEQWWGHVTIHPAELYEQSGKEEPYAVNISSFISVFRHSTRPILGRTGRFTNWISCMFGAKVKKKNLGLRETVEKWTSLLSLPPWKQKHMPIWCYTSATLEYPYSKFLSNHHRQEGRHCCNLGHVIPLAFTFVLCSKVYQD